jgi:HD-GYP domain-containing protein (c-di-GMP phosphodiesterase class II)
MAADTYRGSSAGQLSRAARILAAADMFHMTLEDRPHRPAATEREAAAQLRGEVSAGRLDTDAAEIGAPSRAGATLFALQHDLVLP